jgi:ribonuclease G
MTKEIIINSSSTQTRVAITEDGNLVDFFVDYPENRRMVGDIYLGKSSPGTYRELKLLL